MNRTCYLIITGLSLLLIAGCTSKKEQLTASTLTIAIEPGSVSALSAGNSVQLTAICRSAKSDNVDIAPTWSVDEPNLGTFSPATGKTTVFTAGSDATGKIYASYADVRSAGVNVTVGNGGNIGVYGLYSETFVTHAIKYDTPNPGDQDGGSMGQWGEASISAGTSSNERTEGAEGLKCVIGANGGWFIQFGSDNTAGFNGDTQVAKDMSAFSGGALKFDVKTPQDIIIKVEWTGNSSTEILLNSLGSGLTDNQWHSITIPLSNFPSINLTTIRIPAGFHAASGSNNFTYYIDNVRWEKL